MRNKYNIVNVILLIIIILIVIIVNSGTLLAKEEYNRELDYYKIDSEKTGPTIIIVGGIHGNEIAGFKAAQELINYSPDKGEIYIFFNVNKYGIANNKRLNIDDKDINRCFPGSKDESESDLIAYKLFDFIDKANPDMVIDLHESRICARVNKEGVGQTIISGDNNETIFMNMDAIEKINKEIEKEKYHFISETYPTDNSLTWAVNKYLDIPAFTIETCKNLKLKQRINYHKKIVEYLLLEIGVDINEIQDDSSKTKKSIIF